MKRTIALACLTLTSACGSKSMMTNNTPADMTQPSTAGDLAMSTTPADLAGADFTASGAYPAGPYGNTVGAVIPPLVWEGYNDPMADAVATTKTYGSYTMDDLRKSGRAFGMIHVSDFY